MSQSPLWGQATASHQDFTWGGILAEFLLFLTFWPMLPIFPENYSLINHYAAISIFGLLLRNLTQHNSTSSVLIHVDSFPPGRLPSYNMWHSSWWLHPLRISPAFLWHFSAGLVNAYSWVPAGFNWCLFCLLSRAWAKLLPENQSSVCPSISGVTNSIK